MQDIGDIFPVLLVSDIKLTRLHQTVKNLKKALTNYLSIARDNRYVV